MLYLHETDTIVANMIEQMWNYSETLYLLVYYRPSIHYRLRYLSQDHI